MEGKNHQKPEYRTFKYLAAFFSLVLFLAIVLWPVTTGRGIYPMAAFGLLFILVLTLAISLSQKG